MQEETRPKLTAIFALGKDDVISVDGKIPWNFPADLRHFRMTTQWHPIIMGRKTYESIGSALPKRFNLVLSRSADSRRKPTDGSVWFQTKERVLDYLKGYCSNVFVIGGAEIFDLFLPDLTSMILTRVAYSVPDGIDPSRVQRLNLPQSQFQSVNGMLEVDKHSEWNVVSLTDLPGKCNEAIIERWVKRR